MATYTAQTYTPSVNTGASGIGSIIQGAVGGGSYYQNALAQQSQANQAAIAAQNHQYGLQSQQIGNDLAHQLAAYGIDANNLQIQGGTLNRQTQQLQAMRGIAQQSNALDVNNINLAGQQIGVNRAQAQNQYNQNYRQGLAQAVPTGAVNSAGNIADRAANAQTLANQMAGFNLQSAGNQNDLAKANLDWQTYNQQYFGQAADLADANAKLANDVRALGNQQDAAKTSAALNQQLNAAQRAGYNAGVSGSSGGGGGGSFSLGGGGGANPLADYTPDQINQGINQLQTALSQPSNYQNIGNRNNPLGVSDSAWNQMIFLATLQAGGVQGPQSLQNLNNIMRLVGAAQQQQLAQQRAGAPPGWRP
jgi:hypothetical protein